MSLDTDRLGDWVRRVDEAGNFQGWVRDRVTSGLQNPRWFHHPRSGRVTLTVELDDLPDWDVEIRLERRGDVIAPVEWHATYRGEGAPDATPVYRKLGGADLERAVERELADPLVVRTFLPAKWKDAALQARRHGRQPVSDLELAELADRYVDACSRSRKPMVLMTEEDPLFRSLNTLQSLKRKAVERGLLKLAGHGKAGGELTNKARALLGIEED